MDPIRQIARAVLYEGYLLWPYRRSAMKNQRRWNFGGVYPESYSRRSESDPWQMQMECLVEGDGGARVDVEVRFLHVVARQPVQLDGERLQPVEALTVGGERYLAWEEAAEREVSAAGLRLAGLASPRQVDIAVDGHTEREWLAEANGRRVGALERTWEPLAGTVQVAAEPSGDHLHRLTVRIANRTTWGGDDRQEALKRTLLSTHTIVRASGGRLVSLTDPPPRLRGAAEACDNIGTWPVLVGEEGSRSTMLAAPIILSDYPRVAPESPGDLFDGTEIDELLVHSIRSLTDDERREMRDTDPLAREILERTDALSPEQLLRLHGSTRELRPVKE